jgi:hypothetical protein
MTAQTDPDATRILVIDAVSDLFRALDGHIAARIYHETQGPAYRGENPPNSDEVQQAFVDAVVAVAQILRVTLSA